MGDYRDIIGNSRPVLHHHPMETGHRAKQFAPFAALKGYEETVEKQEVIYEEEPTLSEDESEALNRRLTALESGMIVTILWFEPNHCVWKNRITNQIQRKADEDVRLYRKMRESEDSSLLLGQYRRDHGRILLDRKAIYMAEENLTIPFEQIVDIVTD